MSCEIAKLMQIPMNTLCYLIKLMPLFPSCVIYSPFVALSIFAALSNFSRIIKLLPPWGFKLFFLGVYISLVISQAIPSCETFSRVCHRVWLKPVERFENGAKSSGMSLLVTEIFIYPGRLRLLELHMVRLITVVNPFSLINRSCG